MINTRSGGVNGVGKFKCGVSWSIQGRWVTAVAADLYPIAPNRNSTVGHLSIQADIDEVEYIFTSN